MTHNNFKYYIGRYEENMAKAHTQGSMILYVLINIKYIRVYYVLHYSI